MTDHLSQIPPEYREAVMRSLAPRPPRDTKAPQPEKRGGPFRSLGDTLAVLEEMVPTGEDVEEPEPRCSMCGDSGWLRVGGDWDPYLGVPPVRECRACDLVAGKRRARFEKLSPIQPPFDTYTFETFPAARTPEMSKVRDGLKKLAIGEPCNLYLSGPIGCGKTSLATCLYQQWVTAGTSGMWFLLSKLLAKIRAGFDAETREYTADQLIQSVYDVPLLFVDDLGGESMTPWVAEVLFGIVYSRQDPGKSTIFTSNYSLPDLVDHLTTIKGHGGEIAAERIASRIKGLCGSRIYAVSGPDLR